MVAPNLEKIWQQIKSRAGLDQLAPREKLILAGGVVFVLGFVIFQMVITPYLDSRARLHRAIDTKQKQLTQMHQLQQQYGELRQEEGGIKAALEKRSKSFTLFTFIDQQAGNAGVKKLITYMKPSLVPGAGNGQFSESMVEVKLERIDLENLVKFLDLVESPEKMVAIRRLSIQTSTREQGYLDVILQIVTFTEAS